MTGDFKRSINIPVPIWVGDFMNYDKNHLLVYMKMFPDGMKKHKDSFHPYFLMSKQDGRLKTLDVEVAEMKDGRLHQSYGGDAKCYRGCTIGYQTSPLICNGNDFYISDFASDTIYSFIDMNLEQLVFEVPDACNLRCKYCAYGDLCEGVMERDPIRIKSPEF
ncbi:MAG: hypothetical protein V8S95_05400 [Odoribacter sp.]